MKNIFLKYLTRALILTLFPTTLFAQPIIWEKVVDDNELDLRREIKWEPINTSNDEEYRIDKYKNILSNSNGKQLDNNLLNLGLTVPTANITKEKELILYVDQVFPYKKGEEGGTGNQNYSGFASYGLKENLMLSLFFSHSDDPLHEKINNLSSHPENLWFSYGGSLRWKLIDKKNLKFGIDNSIESWIVKSGGCNGHGCIGSSSNIFNSGLKAVRNENLVGSISAPLTWRVIENVDFTVSPKITFLPKEQGNVYGYGEFYGTNTGIGMGVSYKPNLRFNTFNSIYLPFSGKNNFDNKLSFNKAFIYTSGFNFALDPRTAFEGYITNRFGSSPATSILTIPSKNTLILGSRFIYRPTALDDSKAKTNNKKINNFVNGLSISNSNLIKEGKKFIDFNIDNKGATWTTFIQGLSSSFNFEVAYGNTSDAITENNKYAKTFIEPNNTNIRVGGKAILLSAGNKRSIHSGVRLSFGRSFGETWPGYLFSEITNSIFVNEKMILNFNPKAAWTGEGNPLALGTGVVWKLNDNFYLIPEFNSAISDSESNWTIALRTIPKKNIYLDFYTTNAFNFTDIGELVKSESQSIGMKTAILF